MSSAAPLAAAMPFETEATAIGNQTLVPGVTPITPRDRLAIRANAPMEPRKPQRPPAFPATPPRAALTLASMC